METKMAINPNEFIDGAGIHYVVIRKDALNKLLETIEQLEKKIKQLEHVPLRCMPWD